MSSYYKFAERQADSFVNWAEIGKGITDMLQEEVKIRDDKRAAIDKATRDNIKTLSDAPTGQHQGANTWTLNYANQAREAILMQDRLLKSGALDLKDYTVMRQNINDGTDELFSVLKNYQDVFKTKRDRMLSADPKNRSQAIEMDMMAYTEQFGDFSKSMALIDPKTFTVNVGIMEPDPNNKGVMRLTGTSATSSFLRNIQNTNFDYFDSTAAATAITKGTGRYLNATIEELKTTSRYQGRVVTIEDVRKKPGYDDMMNGQIKAAFGSNPFNITSFLTEDLITDKDGNPYVSNMSGKEGNVIQYTFDGPTNSLMPKLTKEQIDAAYEGMRLKIEAGFDVIIKEDPFNKPQPTQVKAAETPSSQSIDVSNTFLTRIKERTGLGTSTFSPRGSTTAKNLQGVLATIPGGTEFSVETDKKQDGLVNLMQGDQIVKSFDVIGINKDTQQQYLNEFQEIISNLAGMNGMIDYIGRTGGVPQSGGGTGASQFNPK